MRIMPSLVVPRKLLAGALVAVVAVALGVGFFADRAAKAQPPSQPPSSVAWKDLTYAQSGRCSDCHSFPIANRLKATEFVLLTESSIWRAYDKHAQAYAVLGGDRGKQISKLLFGDEKAVLKSKA